MAGVMVFVNIDRLHGGIVYRFEEHTGEVEIVIESPTEAGVFAEALTALAELMGRQDRGEPAQHEIEVTAPDRASLLVEWLTEAVFLAEVERFVPEQVASFELADDRLHATVVGHVCRPRHLVKAVTLNSLELLQTENGAWHGRVVLDV
jgi:SHS2 domain-containing protein